MDTAEPAHPATPRSWLSRAFASVESRFIRMLLLGWFAAGTGYWMQLVAQNWLVLSMTDSPAAVGWVTAFQLFPTLMLGLHGGSIADALPCRRILLVAQCGKAFLAAALALLTATGRVEVWQVYTLAVALGVVHAVELPARQSVLAEMVPAGHLHNAISLVSLAFQIGGMVGPALGGVLMVTLGTEYAFGAAAFAFAVPATVLAWLPPRTNQVKIGGSLGSGLCAGLRYAVLTPTVLWPSLVVGSFGFFTLSLPTTLATLAKNQFHSGPTGMGALSSSLAAGSLIGALISARRGPPVRLRTIAGIAMLLATALLMAAAAPTQSLLTVLLATVGAAYLALLTSAQSLVQLTTMDAFRGRVLGAYMFVFLGSGCVGGPVVGLLAEHFGPRTVLLLSGAVPALITALISHHLSCRANLRLGMATVSVRLQRPTLVRRT